MKWWDTCIALWECIFSSINPNNHSISPSETICTNTDNQSTFDSTIVVTFYRVTHVFCHIRESNSVAA